jgi:hypothetical protein
MAGWLAGSLVSSQASKLSRLAPPLSSSAAGTRLEGPSFGRTERALEAQREEGGSDEIHSFRFQCGAGRASS